jgi:HEAT repeat protein
MTQKQIYLNLGGLGVLMTLLGIVYWLHTGVRAVPGLIEDLQSQDRQTQMLAAEGLKQVGLPARAAVPVLVELATSAGRSSIHSEAAGALPTIDLSAARRVMVHYLPKLQDPDSQIRRDAGSVLGALGPVARPAVQGLLGLLDDSDMVVRERTVRALGAIVLPTDRVMGGLLQAMSDPEWTVRYAAVTQFSFSGFSSPESLAALQDLTKDSNQTVARLAQSAVTSAERPISVAVQLLMLDQSVDRMYPLLQLAKLGPRAAEAVPKLKSLLASELPLERYLTASTLESIGPAAKEAVPALQEALHDTDPVVREAVQAALESITHTASTTP